MLHVCAEKFDLTGNLENFLDFCGKSTRPNPREAVTPASVRLPQASEFRPTPALQQSHAAAPWRISSFAPAAQLPTAHAPGQVTPRLRSGAHGPAAPRPGAALCAHGGTFSGRAKRTPAVPFSWRGGEAAAGAPPGSRSATKRLPPLTSARDLIVALPESQPAQPPTRSPP